MMEHRSSIFFSYDVMSMRIALTLTIPYVSLGLKQRNCFHILHNFVTLACINNLIIGK